MFASLSSAEWNLKIPGPKGKEEIRRRLGHSYPDLEERARRAVYEFVERSFDSAQGALRHYYRADTRSYAEPDSGNFLMAGNYLAMYDRHGEPRMLARAASCFRWAYRNCTELHPMFTWQGGVRDQFRPHELYVKYTSDALRTALALEARAPDDEQLFAARQFHGFVKQARAAGFMAKFDTLTYRFSNTGFAWNTFGGPLLAYLQFYELTSEERYLAEARAWADHGLTLQAENGAFYLIDNAFWNSDLVAPELLGLTFLHEVTGRAAYLAAAIRYADWLLPRQRDDGAWPIGIDRDDEICAPNVGPGDMPHIALALVRLHRNTGDDRYLQAAIAAVRYGIRMQAVEDGKYPVHLDDPHVRWGFWSWDPAYDHSLSGDQSVHHVRGMLMVADYIGSLADESA